MFYYLYKITNLINSKEYIGVHSSKSLEDSYYGSGRLIKLAIKKYGKENFRKEILMLADTYQEVLELERIAVDNTYIKNRLTYNLREGGNGGWEGEENPFYGKTHCQEVKNKLSKIRTGIKDDTKRKGWWVTPYGKFRTYREAAKACNVSTGTIKRRCKTYSNKRVGFYKDTPKEFQGEKTWREQGWYFEEFRQD